MILRNEQTAVAIMLFTVSDGEAVNEGTQSTMNLNIGKIEGAGGTQEDIENVVETLDQLSEENTNAINDILEENLHDWKILTENGYPG